jgi:hypothetical protein
VYRPTTGQWFIGGHAQPVAFGMANVDIPVPGDYDGTGHVELAVYRPTTGQWFIGGHAQPIQVGAAGTDLPVRGDFDGDGRTDPAVFRPATAQWLYQGTTAGSRSIQFGAGGTPPASSTWLSARTLTARSAASSFAISAAIERSGVGSSARTPVHAPSRHGRVRLVAASLRRPGPAPV